MKRNSSITLAAALLLLALTNSGPLRAADEDVSATMTILRRMKEVLEPARPSLRKIVMSVSSGGETVQKIMGQAFKEFPDGKRMLVVMLSPEDVRGMGYLIMEREGGSDIMFNYVPFIRRTREMSRLADRYASFFGTDFTYSDLGFVKLRESYRVLGEEKYSGVDGYAVEETISDQHPCYSKIITWVSRQTMLPLRRDFYDTSGELWKTELFEDVSVIEGVPTPSRIIMQDLQANSSTELQISDVQYCATLEDKLFDPENLGQVAADPIWQPYCTLPGAGE